MVPQRDATGTIYAAGGLLTLVGLMQLAKGNTALGIAALVVGPLLIVQRVLTKRKRDRG
jgi:4-amino-4-deoxy-L-arabinose transferase-like glycosyltransferase